LKLWAAQEMVEREMRTPLQIERYYYLPSHSHHPTTRYEFLGVIVFANDLRGERSVGNELLLKSEGRYKVKITKQ